MRLSAICGLVFVGFALVLGASELSATIINNSYVYVLVAGAATAFMFSMSTEGTMTNTDEDVVRLEGLGAKASIPARVLDKHLLVVLMFSAIIGLQIYTLNILTRLIEATSENTYVLSLSQADRERLNIVMPESLRRKIGR